MKNILDMLKVFVPAFLFFAAVGSIAGYHARKEVALEKLLEEINVKQQESAYFFEFACPENNLTYLYSIDDNKGKYLGSVTALAALQKTALALPSKRLAEYKTLMGSILGGATGGVTLRSVLKKPSGGWTWRQAQKTIIGIIGSITGYSVGYRMGSHYDTDCDSKLTASVLDNPDIWLRIERARLLVSMLILENLEGAIVAQSGKAISTWDKDPAFMCSPKLLKAKTHLATHMNNPIIDPTSEHFQLINNIAYLHDKISQTPEYKTLIAGQLYKHSNKLKQFKKTGEGLGEIVAKKEKEWDIACSIVAAIDL